MNLYLRIFLFGIFIILAVGITYALGYREGKAAGAELASSHGRTFGAVKMASEIANKTGYRSNGKSTPEMTIIEFSDIKDFRYYIVEVNGVKTVAAHE